MKTFIVAMFSVICSLSASAINELGSLDVARKNHPAVFVPGNVLEYSVGTVKGYAYNGEAEKCFDGDMAESDAELFQEATLDAKKNLYKHLTKEDKTLTIRMNGVKKLYEYSEGKMRRVVLFVAQSDVEVLKRESSVQPEKVVMPIAVTTQSVVVAEQQVNINDANKGTPISIPEHSDVSNSVQAVKESRDNEVDRLGAYLKAIEANPSDCVSISRAAKLYARRDQILEAKKLYSNLVKQVVMNEKMDKEFAAGLLLEAAKFEKVNGDVDCALKYYRLVIRCDGMRRWHLNEQVDEANQNITLLLLKAF
jgi:hypothetical protein